MTCGLFVFTTATVANQCAPCVANSGPGIVQTVSALLVPFVAIGAAVIAFNQFRVARQKLKLDLFEKRYAVFAAVRHALSVVMREAKFKIEELYEFRAGTADAYFLFDKKVLDYLDEVDKNLVRFHTTGLQLSGLQGRRGLSEEEERRRVKAVDSEGELLTWLMDQLPRLRKQFAPYLAFGKWV